MTLIAPQIWTDPLHAFIAGAFVKGTPRPIPHMVAPASGPGMGEATPVPMPAAPAPQQRAQAQKPAVRPQQQASAAPGFSF